TNTLEQKIPSLFVWGSSTDFRAFNSLNLGYSLESYRNNNTDVSAAFAPEFSLFNLEDDVSGMFRTFPPLAVPFGDYGFSPGVTSILYQQVGQVKTKKPLVSFNKVDENKIGLIAGEGIWRWRLSAYQEFETHDLFNEFFVKTVQYLASKEDKSLFRVNGKNDFFENENIVFEAELYNQSYEPVTNREIGMRIKNDNGE